MKLGELRSAIRGHKGTVLVEAVLGGKVVQIPVQKTSFMAETLEAFGEHKGVESYLTLTEEGVVVPEGGSEDTTGIDLEDVTADHESANGDDDLLGDSGLDDTDDEADDGFDDLLG